MRALLVVNHKATTTSGRVRDVLVQALRSVVDLDVEHTQQRGHATTLAAQAAAANLDLVVVLGGDGTVNEVVNGLPGAGVPLGLVGGGKTNVLVRALGLPTDPVESTGILIARALDEVSTKLHLGRADGRYFAVNCGAGIDASAMRRLEKKFPSTKAKYDRVAFRAVAWELMVGYAGKKPDLEVTIDGGTPFPSLSVMVGRTDPYTFYKEHGLRMTPDASLATGLDVLSVRKLNRRNIPRIAWQV